MFIKYSLTYWIFPSSLAKYAFFCKFCVPWIVKISHSYLTAYRAWSEYARKSMERRHCDVVARIIENNVRARTVLLTAVLSAFGRYDFTTVVEWLTIERFVFTNNIPLRSRIEPQFLSAANRSRPTDFSTASTVLRSTFHERMCCTFTFCTVDVTCHIHTATRIIYWIWTMDFESCTYKGTQRKIFNWGTKF
jgi:hypothetical protein